MIITQIVSPPFSPSMDDCETLLVHTKSVICGLETVLDRLYEVSSAPDEAMVLIRNKAEAMLSEAETVRSNLNLMKAELVNKMNLYS